MALAREHHYAWKNLAGGHFSEKRENPRYEGNAAHDVNNRPTTTEGFHPGPTSISRSSVTWSKTTPISSETKRNNGGRREEKKTKKGREKRKGKKGKKQREALFLVAKITLIRFEEKTLLSSNAKDGIISRERKRRRVVEISRENLFALEIIS